MLNRPSSNRRFFQALLQPYSIPFTSHTSRPTSGQSRPYTAQTRPGSARPWTTAASVRQESRVAREVGIAALDRETGRVMLVQLADYQTYVETLHQMHLHPPAMVLVSDTFLSTSDASSPSMLLCVEDDEFRPGILLAVANKYYALSAVCALFKDAETKFNTRFASGSLRIRYVPVEGTMMIYPDTARNLELVGNMSFKKSTHSLFGAVRSAISTRHSQLNILSPITAQNTVDARLDVVEELVQSEERFTDVRAGLKPLNKMDFNKLIACLASFETKPSNTTKPVAARVSQMFNLQNVVQNLPALQKVLEGSQSQLLKIIHAMLSDERLAKIGSLICTNLNQDGAPAKVISGSVNFLRSKLNSPLGQLQQENVGDIFALNRTLSDMHGLPLSLLYHDTGLVLTLRKNELEGELPRGFINATLKKGKWSFTSMDLGASDEMFILSEKIIQDLVADILVDVGTLYKASEAVALLDMLWSFPHTSIIRPEFTGTLAIKSGRHPVLETIKSAGTLIPNDVYCDDSSSFQIVQGKSTYLRQVGLLTVLAMCGCFVPAEYASFRIHDVLLTRLSNDDDMEKSLSTFASEMATSAMILSKTIWHSRLASPQSLVLIDELGRGTSPREGVGISHAIAEGLIELKSFVFFATHFNELTTTLSRQPSVIKCAFIFGFRVVGHSHVDQAFTYRFSGRRNRGPILGRGLARLGSLETVGSRRSLTSQQIVEDRQSLAILKT
ncbi:muts domain V-domain-containing protein [Mycena albidolilacea]|uniref:Muts domain V-domain-containing protein n=1 Tax=Mycena albidolilacea TaxID=1033008 RepID=A0AAD7AAV0_9AGAR|nr:muts domain V-domain-containing protein [Mycena albidolilacea]